MEEMHADPGLTYASFAPFLQTRDHTAEVRVRIGSNRELSLWIRADYSGLPPRDVEGRPLHPCTTTHVQRADYLVGRHGNEYLSSPESNVVVK